MINARRRSRAAAAIRSNRQTLHDALRISCANSGEHAHRLNRQNPIAGRERQAQIILRAKPFEGCDTPARPCFGRPSPLSVLPP